MTDAHVRAMTDRALDEHATATRRAYLKAANEGRPQDELTTLAGAMLIARNELIRRRML